jgi:hypothetical protein
MREPRERLIVDLLQDGWNRSNTFGQTPHISFGWFDDSKDRPQVTVRQADEGPVYPGTDPFDAITPDGSGDLHQTVTGQVVAHCWAEARKLGSASTSNPRQYLAAASEEINRIIGTNQITPTNPSTGNQPVESLAAGAGNPVPEPDHSARFHYRKPIAHRYTDS